jgi:hypothetical protein
MKAVTSAFAAATLCLLAGCFPAIKDSVNRYSDAPALPPTTAWVQVVRVEPFRPYDKLGEIELEATTNPAESNENIENRLRAGGASLGADAVVISYDTILPAKEGSTSAYASKRRDHDWKRRIVGVAIKYRE